MRDSEVIEVPKIVENTVSAELLLCKFEECGKAFYDLASLKKHMVTHGER